MGVGIKMGGGGGGAATYAWLKTPVVNGEKIDAEAKYITSDNPNAFPEYDVVGGYFYERVPLRVTNGELRRYRSAEGVLPANTFVQLSTTYSVGTQASFSETSYLMDSVEMNDHQAVVIDYNSGAMYATIYNLQDDNTIVRGNRCKVATVSTTDSLRVARPTRLSETEFVLTFQDKNSRANIVVCTLAGNDVTAGTAVVLGTVSKIDAGRSFVRTDGAIMTIFNQSSKLYYTISKYENGEITVLQTETEVGNPLGSNSNTLVDLERLDDNTYAILTSRTASTSTHYVHTVVMKITADGAVFGTSVQLGTFGDYDTGKLRRLSDTKYAVAALISTKVSVCVCTVDGDVITASDAVTSSVSAFKYIALAENESGSLAVSYLQATSSKYYCYLNIFKVAADGALTLTDTQTPYGSVSMDRLYSEIILQPVGYKMLSAVDKGSTIESVIIEHGSKVYRATGTIEGITRTKVYENVTGEVWVLGG